MKRAEGDRECNGSPIGSSASAEVLMFFPELGPGLARRAADEDVGVVLAFFVAYAFGVAVVAGRCGSR